MSRIFFLILEDLRMIYLYNSYIQYHKCILFAVTVQVLCIIMSIIVIAIKTASFQRFESQRVNGRKLPWAMWLKKYCVEVFMIQLSNKNKNISHQFQNYNCMHYIIQIYLTNITNVDSIQPGI